MIIVKQRDGEERLHYLTRVAIKVLRENSGHIDFFEFDEAECDANCLADDLETEIS